MKRTANRRQATRRVQGAWPFLYSVTERGLVLNITVPIKARHTAKPTSKGKKK